MAIKFYELCSHCGKDATLEVTAKPQFCSECGKPILPCGLCYECTRGESGCPFEDYTEGKVVTFVYRTPKIFSSQKDALDFYTDCMRNSEGSERDRYANIFFQLLDGETVCFDELE